MKVFPTLTSRNWKYTGEPRSPAGWTQSETAAGPTSTPRVPSSGGQGQTLHTRSPVRFPKDRAIQTASYVFKDLHALMQLCKHEPLREDPVSSPQPEQQGVCQPGTPVAARPAAPAAQRHSFGNTRRACPVCQAQFWGPRMLHCIKSVKNSHLCGAYGAVRGRGDRKSRNK